MIVILLYSKAKRQDADSGVNNVYCLLLPPYTGEETDPAHGGLLLVGGKLIALYLQVFFAYLTVDMFLTQRSSDILVTGESWLKLSMLTLLFETVTRNLIAYRGKISVVLM